MIKSKLTTKILNHLTKDGKKIKSEKILLQSVKKIQKPLKKQSKRILQLALILSSPVFKFSSITQKNRKKKKDKITPSFIANSNARTSLVIKSILKEAKNRQAQRFFQAFSEKLIETNNLTGQILHIKNITQKKILVNKRLFKYYR